MVKYCSECDESYYDENYMYCPICSSELEEIDKDYLKIKRIFGIESDEDNFKDDIFEIDKENKVVKAKWNNGWVSVPFQEIIDDFSIKATPPRTTFFQVIGFEKKRWDEQLEKDLPDFKKKLTYDHVKRCIYLVKIPEYKRYPIEPKFIETVKVADFNAKDILNALKRADLIYDFVQLRKDELYLILLMDYGKER